MLLQAAANVNHLVEDTHVGKVLLACVYTPTVCVPFITVLPQFYTPLALAARKGRSVVIQLLLDAGAKVSSRCLFPLWLTCLAHKG